jgi:iron complex transport system permease protein
MQTLFSNPLAGPSVLGINSGAGLGVAVAVLAGEAVQGAVGRSASGAAGASAAAIGSGAAGTGTAAVAAGGGSAAGGTGAAAALLEEASLAGNVSLVLAAAAGAAVVLLLVLFTSRKVGNVMTLLLLGILFGFAADAAVSVLMHLSAAERIQAYVFWSFGSFQGVPLDGLWLFAACVVPGVALGIASAKGLNALLLGEGYARTMGVPVSALRVLVVVATALLAGSATAFCGPITFIGIAVPHLTRSLLATSDHRRLIPGVLLLGACAAVFADIVAQLPGTDMVLPLNAVTSLLGAPVIIWVILRKRNIQEGFSA